MGGEGTPLAPLCIIVHPVHNVTPDIGRLRTRLPSGCGSRAWRTYRACQHRHRRRLVLPNIRPDRADRSVPSTQRSQRCVVKILAPDRPQAWGSPTVLSLSILRQRSRLLGAIDRHIGDGDSRRHARAFWDTPGSVVPRPNPSIVNTRGGQISMSKGSKAPIRPFAFGDRRRPRRDRIKSDDDQAADCVALRGLDAAVA